MAVTLRAAHEGFVTGGGQRSSRHRHMEFLHWRPINKLEDSMLTTECAAEFASESAHPRDIQLTNREPAHTAESRYAIYFVPNESSAWWRFGTLWLGRDMITGKPVARQGTTIIAGVDDDYLDRITREPQRYGLHATLKAPVHLAPGYAPHDVYRQTAHLAAMQAQTRCYSHDD